VTEPLKTPLEQKLAQPGLIEAAVKKGIREAVLAQARAGHPISTVRDGRVVWIEPAEILAQFAVDPSSGQAG
jgi:predicted metal-dependent phosphotriesterase family hydrolase